MVMHEGKPYFVVRAEQKTFFMYNLQDPITQKTMWRLRKEFDKLPGDVGNV